MILCNVHFFSNITLSHLLVCDQKCIALSPAKPSSPLFTTELRAQSTSIHFFYCFKRKLQSNKMKARAIHLEFHKSERVITCSIKYKQTLNNLILNWDTTYEILLVFVTENSQKKAKASMFYVKCSNLSRIVICNYFISKNCKCHNIHRYETNLIFYNLFSVKENLNYIYWKIGRLCHWW